MKRRKTIAEPRWLTWEGDDFPRKIHSDSVVFYLTEHVYLEEDDLAKKALARQLQQEGIVYSLSEGFKLIDEGWTSRHGYYFDEDDLNYPVYCDNDDPNCEWDATFVEVPYVF